jgi:hypothetical protein
MRAFIYPLGCDFGPGVKPDCSRVAAFHNGKQATADMPEAAK